MRKTVATLVALFMALGVGVLAAAPASATPPTTNCLASETLVYNLPQGTDTPTVQVYNHKGEFYGIVKAGQTGCADNGTHSLRVTRSYAAGSGSAKCYADPVLVATDGRKTKISYSVWEYPFYKTRVYVKTYCGTPK